MVRLLDPTVFMYSMYIYMEIVFPKQWSSLCVLVCLYECVNAALFKHVPVCVSLCSYTAVFSEPRLHVGLTFNQICPVLLGAGVCTGVCAHANTIVIPLCVCVGQGCGAHWLRAARLNREDTLSSRPQLWHFPSPLRAPLVWVRFVFPHSFTASKKNISFSDDWRRTDTSSTQLCAVIDNATLQERNMISLPRHADLSVNFHQTCNLFVTKLARQI